MWELRELREAGHDVRIRCLLKHDHVGRAGADHGRDRLFASRAPVTDVVAQEPERHARTVSAGELSDASSFFPSTSVKYGWSINTSRTYCTMLDVARMFTGRPAVLRSEERRVGNDG